MRVVGSSIPTGGASPRRTGTSSLKRRRGFRIGRRPPQGRAWVCSTISHPRVPLSGARVCGLGRIGVMNAGDAIDAVGATDAVAAVTTYSFLLHDIPLYTVFAGMAQAVAVAGTILMRTHGNLGDLRDVGDVDDVEGRKGPGGKHVGVPGAGRQDAGVDEVVEDETSGSVLEIPSDAAGIWNAAWAPFGGREGCATREPVSWVGRARPEATWVGAIDQWRVDGLLQMCLKELEVTVGKGTRLAGAGGDEDEGVEEMLDCVTRQVAERWLGYVPSLLHGIQESPGDQVPRESAVRGYQVVPVDGTQRGVVYGRVLRLLQSAECLTAYGCIKADDFSTVDEGKIPVSWSCDPGTASTVDGQAHATATSMRLKSLYSVAPFVIHDMAMSIADRVCAAYLRDVVAGGDGPRRGSNQGAAPLAKGQVLWPAFLDPRLCSTREVQRFINRMYFGRLVDEYVHETMAIYEDRLPLTRLDFRVDANGRSRLIIRKMTVRTRRYHELAALRGIKYGVSLMVECYDLLRPMLANCRQWCAVVVSWILREVIGKGIGFVWEGMRNARSDGGVERRGQRPTRNAQGGDDSQVDEAWPGAGVYV